MGLTINFKLRVSPQTTETKIRELVMAMRARAVALQRAGRVEAVGKIKPAKPGQFWLSEWLHVPVGKNASRGIEIPVVGGQVFTVTLGEGSESLQLGLCRYPTRVRDTSTGRMRLVRRTGWRLSGFCKTQYASLQGWENFLRCHAAAVELLAGLSELGLAVEISDEGEYWPGRDEAALRRKIGQYNGLVAAFAGLMKDAGEEEDADIAAVQSPIFGHPQFERVEAEGHAEFGEKLEKAVKAVRKEGRGKRKG